MLEWIMIALAIAGATDGTVTALGENDKISRIESKIERLETKAAKFEIRKNKVGTYLRQADIDRKYRKFRLEAHKYRLQLEKAKALENGFYLEYPTMKNQEVTLY